MTGFFKGMSALRGLKYWDALGLAASMDASVLAGRQMVLDHIRAVHDEMQGKWIAKGRDPEDIIRSTSQCHDFKSKFVDESAQLPQVVRNLGPEEAGEALFDLYRFFRCHDPVRWGLSPETKWQKNKRVLAEKEGNGKVGAGQMEDVDQMEDADQMESADQTEGSQYQTEDQLDAAVLEHVGGWLMSQDSSEQDS